MYMCVVLQRVKKAQEPTWICSLMYPASLITSPAAPWLREYNQDYVGLSCSSNKRCYKGQERTRGADSPRSQGILMLQGVTSSLLVVTQQSRYLSDVTKIYTVTSVKEFTSPSRQMGTRIYCVHYFWNTCSWHCYCGITLCHQMEI